VEDFVENITRGNPGSVKTVLASIVLALASYQLILAAIGYRKLPVIEAEPAFFTHRASGDLIAVLLVLVALACLAVFGLEDDYVVHGAAGIATARSSSATTAVRAAARTVDVFVLLMLAAATRCFRTELS
jgi:uncharacterized protein DUF6529